MFKFWDTDTDTDLILISFEQVYMKLVVLAELVFVGVGYRELVTNQSKMLIPSESLRTFSFVSTYVFPKKSPCMQAFFGLHDLDPVAAQIHTLYCTDTSVD